MPLNQKNKTDIVTGVLGIGLGFGLFYLCLKAFTKKDAPADVKQIAITAENIQIAVDAYKQAVIEGEDSDHLDALNKQFAPEFGVKVSYNSLSNEFAVYDLNGKLVKTVS